SAPENSVPFTTPFPSNKRKPRLVYLTKKSTAEVSDTSLGDMVAGLGLPLSPDLVSSLFGAIPYEEPCCAFCEGRVRRHRDRIRSDCSRHCTRDHRRSTGRRKLDVHQLQHHLDQPEISRSKLNT